MAERDFNAAGGATDALSECGGGEPSANYRQISYEELEECVLSVRDSIADFYLAPQGEISFAAVEAAQAAPLRPYAPPAFTSPVCAPPAFTSPVYAPVSASVYAPVSAPAFMAPAPPPAAQAKPVFPLYREDINRHPARRKASFLKYLLIAFAGAVFGGILVLLGAALLLPRFGYAVQRAGYAAAPAESASAAAGGAAAAVDGARSPGRVKTGIRYSQSFNDNYDLYKQQFPDIPKGVYVEYVEPLSGAFTAGIMAGDIVVSMKGDSVADVREMLAVMETLSPGDIVDVEIFRDGKNLTFSVEVSAETGQ